MCALVTGVQTCALPIWSRELGQHACYGGVAGSARPDQVVGHQTYDLDRLGGAELHDCSCRLADWQPVDGGAVSRHQIVDLVDEHANQAVVHAIDRKSTSLNSSP